MTSFFIINEQRMGPQNSYYFLSMIIREFLITRLGVAGAFLQTVMSMSHL